MSADGLEVQAGNVHQAVEEDFALFAEADEGNVDGVLGIGGGSREDTGGAEDEAGSGGTGGAGEEAAAVDGV